MNSRKRAENQRRLILGISRILLAAITTSFFLYYLVVEVSRYTGSQEVVHDVDVATTIADFIHLTANERGKSNIYLSSTSDVWAYDAVVEAQRATQQLLPTLSNDLLSLYGSIPSSIDAVPPTLELLQNLTLVESMLLNRNLSASDSFEFYTNINENLFRVMSQVVYYDDTELTRELQGLLYLNWYLEWLGQERATIGRVFAMQSLGDVISFSAKYFSIQQTQKQLYLQLKLCSPDLITTLQSIETNTDFVQTLSIVNSRRQAVMGVISSDNKSSLSYSSMEWWNNITIIIDTYYEVNPVIVSSVHTSIEQYRKIAITGLVIGLLGTIFEILASVQLLMVALPVFLLYLSWTNISHRGSKSTEVHPEH